MDVGRDGEGIESSGGAGAKYCPSGFRLLSNFGSDAMQSQAHGHVHVVGGTYLGEYA